MEVDKDHVVKSWTRPDISHMHEPNTFGHAGVAAGSGAGRSQDQDEDDGEEIMRYTEDDVTITVRRNRVKTTRGDPTAIVAPVTEGILLPKFRSQPSQTLDRPQIEQRALQPGQGSSGDQVQIRRRPRLPPMFFARSPYTYVSLIYGATHHRNIVECEGGRRLD